MVRSDKLIELGNSWFSPKQLLGWRRVFLIGVEHWKILSVAIPQDLSNSEYYKLSAAVRPWGLSSIGQKGNSLDLNLRSLNICSVHWRWWIFSDGEDVGLEAAII